MRFEIEDEEGSSDEIQSTDEDGGDAAVIEGDISGILQDHRGQHHSTV